MFFDQPRHFAQIPFGILQSGAVIGIGQQPESGHAAEAGEQNDQDQQRPGGGNLRHDGISGKFGRRKLNQNKQTVSPTECYGRWRARISWHLVCIITA
jgi:hypothetical protein